MPSTVCQSQVTEVEEMVEWTALKHVTNETTSAVRKIIVNDENAANPRKQDFLSWIGEYNPINSSKTIRNFPAVFDFNRLFLKLNWFICS
jgi:hypothetical protein